MKLEKIHEVNRIAFRAGLNAMKGSVEKSFLVKNIKHLDKEWVYDEDPFNPGVTPTRRTRWSPRRRTTF